MQVPYNFQQVINNNQYQVINGVKCFPVSMLDENFNYLCKVVNVGSTTPTISYDGQFWFDGTTLKIAQSSSWKDIKVANAVNADKLGGLLPGQFLRSDQNTVCSGGITAQQFASTTTSAPPFVVSSNQLVTNLCADYVDGYHIDSTGASTGQLVQFDTTNVKLKPAPIYVVSGNVGIGVTSPQANLHIGGGESIYFGGGGNTYPTTPSSGNGVLVGKSGTSDFRLVLQDGAGRVNMYWNAYYDSSAGAHKYIVSNEPACRFLEQVNGTTGCLFQFFGAPAGTAGNTITWTPVAEFASGADVWLSPRGTSSDFFINSSGTVGIGTTSPSGKLEVYGGYIFSTEAESGAGKLRVGAVWGYPGLYVETANKDLVFGTNSGGIRFVPSGNTHVYITPSGNVGIGTASPSYKLDVAGDIRSVSSGYIYIHPAGSDADQSHIRIVNTASSTASPFVSFGYGSYIGLCSVYMAMSDKSLKLNISKTSDGLNFRDAIIIPPANGTPTACIIPSSSGGYVADWPSGWGGGLSTYDICCTGVYYNTLTQRSDANLKTDVQPLSDYLNTDCLDVISCLRPVKYVYVDDPLKTNRFGFIAQDVSEVCPELVTVDTEGKASLNYMDLIALLTKGIQELYDMLGKVIQKIGGIS